MKNQHATPGPASAIDLSQTPYLTVDLFNKKHPAFPVGTLRHYLFYRETNGLVAAGAVFKSGRKILIKESAFFNWMESGNPEKIA